MVTASDIVRDGWSAVPGAIFWIFVVWGLGKAIFRGFWAQELRMRLDRRQVCQLDAIRQAQWELRTGRQFHLAAARNGDLSAGRPDDMAAAPLLTEAELAERRAFLDQQVTATIWLRAFRYLLGCTFCQTFWSATLCFLTASLVGLAAPSPWLDWLPTCLAYAALATWVTDLPAGQTGRGAAASASTSRDPQAAWPPLWPLGARGGCPGCGTRQARGLQQ